MDRNDRMYTREADGTIARWYVNAWVGNRFGVSPVRNAKLHDYTKYFDVSDIGKTIFFTRSEAAKHER